MRHSNGCIVQRKVKVSEVESKSASTSEGLNDLELAENDVNVSAIELRGFKDVSKDYVRLFFENQKHSGGGEISQFEWDERSGRAIVTYESSEGKVCH